MLQVEIAFFFPSGKLFQSAGVNALQIIGNFYTLWLMFMPKWLLIA